MESYRATESDPDDDVLIRKIRDGHAIKQYLMWMHAESATLDSSGDSEQSVMETD